MKNRRDQRFKQAVWTYYREYGRHDLPWRKSVRPYHILVSEVMLQQTQVDRVVPKYRSFLKRFPSARALARAGLSDVLREWQGLGYNRRAKMLHAAANVVAERGGRFPRTYEELLMLPGVGHYTAGAVMAFSYNEPVSLIETNIRTVYLYHFFSGKSGVTDREIAAVIERTLERPKPREWFWALMDYGAYLKRTIGNQNHRARTYAKQSRFRGSDREIRGAVLRRLTERPMTKRELRNVLSFEPLRLDAQLAALCREGLIEKGRGRYGLPT